MEQSWIKQASLTVWNDIFQKVKHAVVFMDHSCAECLFWSGGPMALFDAGAIDIKDFSSFECGNDQQKKAVFVISSLLEGKTMSILRDIITASKFQYTVVFTTIDIESHRTSFGVDSQTGNLIFEQCEEKFCEFMGSMNYTCEVFYAPIFMECFASFLFLVPSLNNFFPLQNQDLPALDSMRKAKGEKHPIQRLSDIHFYSLPICYQTQIKQLVMYFNQLFETLSLKEELFAVGTTSRLVATQLANLPSGRQRRKAAATTASLVLLDRSLDPVATSRHSDKSLSDQILGILPELPGHCNNVSVDMVRLTSAKTLLTDKINADEYDSISGVVSCPGCLCPPNDSCPQLLQDMISLPHKPAIGLIKRSLMEACIEEGINVPDEDSDSTKTNAEEIFQLVERFYGNAGAIMYHSNLLQLSMAAAQTQSNSFHKKWMELCAMEKLLILNEDPISKLVELSNEVNEEGAKQWTAEDIIGLLLFICSIKDLSSISDDIWDDLASSLSLVISDSDADELPLGLGHILGIEQGENNEAELDLVQDVVEQTIDKLKSLHSRRKHLSHFQGLLKSSLGPPEYESLIIQLMKKVLNPSKPDLQPDVEHVSTGLMDLLKSGFSMFKKVTQPRPNDAKVMFIFVIGGMTFEEAASVNDMVSEYNSRQQTNLQVILGSTRIASPRDAIDKFLFVNNLSPAMSE